MSNTARSDRYVYADYASFSPIDGDILSAMLPYYGEEFGNPSSLHKRGRNATKALRESRERIAHVLSVAPQEIVFTGSGTEANNCAILGAARANRHKGDHVIISLIEHPSVMEAANLLEKEGFEVSRVPVQKNGVIDVEACLSFVTDSTILVSVMYVNNEIGTIQPIRELARKLKMLSRRPLLHTDACQAANLLPLGDIASLVDMMTLNSTKVSGPSGVGMLYVRTGVMVQPLALGGDQERGVRAGTENVPGIVGFSLALAKAQSMRETESVRLLGLRRYFCNGLKNRIPSVHIHGDEATQVSSIVHVTVPRIEGEAMLLLLDSRGIYASTGSACASLHITASHVLTAIGQDPDTIHGSLRFSFGRSTTKEDIDYILEAFPVVTERLYSMTALTEEKV